MPNVNYTVLYDQLVSSGITFPFMFGITPPMLSANLVNIAAYPTTRFSGATAPQWYESAGFVSGFTNDKLNMVRSYSNQDPYIENLVMNAENYDNYINAEIFSGVTMITASPLIDPLTYVVDTEAGGPIGQPQVLIDNQAVLGTIGQTTGLLYETFSAQTYEVVGFDGLATDYPKTTMRWVGEGWNETNVDLQAMTKTEYLMGIVFPPEVQSDVFIDRGTTTVTEDHLRLGEIKGLEALLDYGNGYYTVGI